MHNRRHDDPVRGAVAPEAIGDEATGQAAAPLQEPTKEPCGGVAIPTRLQQDLDHIAVLVAGAPEVLTLAASGQEEFVQMPRVADRLGATPELPGGGEAEGFAPVPEGPVRDRNAPPARRSSTWRKLRVNR